MVQGQMRVKAALLDLGGFVVSLIRGRWKPFHIWQSVHVPLLEVAAVLKLGYKAQCEHPSFAGFAWALNVNREPPRAALLSHGGVWRVAVAHMARRCACSIGLWWN